MWPLIVMGVVSIAGSATSIILAILLRTSLSKSSNLGKNVGTLLKEREALKISLSKWEKAFSDLQNTLRVSEENRVREREARLEVEKQRDRYREALLKASDTGTLVDTANKAIAGFRKDEPKT